MRTIPTDSLRDGVVYYLCKTSSQCPAVSQGVTGISGAKYDIPDGYFAVNKAQITTMDPQHLGPNAATLAYFNSFPHPNDGSVGDGLNVRLPIQFADIGRARTVYREFDYNITRDARRRFLSGALASESNPQGSTCRVPAGSPSITLRRNTALSITTKVVINYSGVITNNLVNSFRYGLCEGIGDIGDSDRPTSSCAASQGVTRVCFQRPITRLQMIFLTRGRHVTVGGSLRTPQSAHQHVEFIQRRVSPMLPGSMYPMLVKTGHVRPNFR